jgi:hypothetical protein
MGKFMGFSMHKLATHLTDGGISMHKLATHLTDGGVSMHKLVTHLAHTSLCILWQYAHPRRRGQHVLYILRRSCDQEWRFTDEHKVL